MNNDLYHYPRLHAASLQHLEQLLIEYGNQHKGVEILELKISVNYRPHVQNTHYCPIDGGVTNWHKKEELPTGYPALFGNIYIRYAQSCYDKFNISKFVGINTGCGGGGNPQQFELFLFLDDFPLIKQAIIEEQAKIEQAKHIAAKLYEQYNLSVTQDNVIVDLDKNIAHLTDEIAKLQKDLSKVYAHKSRYVLDTHKQPLYDLYNIHKQSVGDLVYMKNFPMLDF